MPLLRPQVAVTEHRLDGTMTTAVFRWETPDGLHHQYILTDPVGLKQVDIDAVLKMITDYNLGSPFPE